VDKTRERETTPNHTAVGKKEKKKGWSFRVTLGYGELIRDPELFPALRAGIVLYV
jgi:hypothetical protein